MLTPLFGIIGIITASTSLVFYYQNYLHDFMLL